MIDRVLIAVLLASFAVVAYVYLGYGAIASLFVALGWARRAAAREEGELPSVRLVIAACDEEHAIAEKLRNTQALDYPPERLRVTVAADGSQDATVEIAEAFDGLRDLRVLHRPQRRGKLAAVERAVEESKEEIIVFTDADAQLDPRALTLLVVHFGDPQVGCVAGEKRVRLHPRSSSGPGESLYWRYESWLKRLDARLHSACGAAGELFAVRRDVWRRIPPDSIIEDFHLSLDIARRGYRIAYEPDAFSEENPTTTLGEELKRRSRIAHGGFQSVTRLRTLFNPVRYGWLSFCLFSRRVLRWFAAPVCLLLAFVLAPVAWSRTGDPWLLVLTIAQSSFYALAAIGAYAETRRRTPRLFYLPWFFTLAHVAALAGLWRWIRGVDDHVWERATRVR